MSWNFSFNAINKAEAKAAVAQRVSTGYGLTEAAAAAIIAQIDALPSTEDNIVAVTSSGHIDSNTGNMTAEVKLVRVERVRLDASENNGSDDITPAL